VCVVCVSESVCVCVLVSVCVCVCVSESVCVWVCRSMDAQSSIIYKRTARMPAGQALAKEGGGQAGHRPTGK